MPEGNNINKKRQRGKRRLAAKFCPRLFGKRRRRRRRRREVRARGRLQSESGLYICGVAGLIELVGCVLTFFFFFFFLKKIVIKIEYAASLLFLLWCCFVGRCVRLVARLFCGSW